jgi:hypothetical protein
VNRKLIISWALVFLVWMLGNFLIQAVLLSNDYGQLPNLFRPEAETMRYFPFEILALVAIGWSKDVPLAEMTLYFPFEILAHVIMAGALAWVYSKGVSATPWFPQGLRFGVAVALLTAVPTYLIYYAVQPLPGMLVVKQVVLGLASGGAAERAGGLPEQAGAGKGGGPASSLAAFQAPPRLAGALAAPRAQYGDPPSPKSEGPLRLTGTGPLVAPLLSDARLSRWRAGPAYF